MPCDSVFSGHDSEGVCVVGYLPTKFTAFIPNAVLIKKDEAEIILEQNHSFRECSDEELTSIVRVSLVILKGEWIVVEDGIARVISLEKMNVWRGKKAEEMVRTAANLKGNPLLVLNLLEGASKLRDFDLRDFVSVLKAKRTTEESLDAVFLRVRDTR